MSEHERPIATVDVVLFTLADTEADGDGGLRVLLVEREREPFRGRAALPGGYVHVAEDADTADTARRVLAGKLGVRAPYLEQLYTFGGRERDPRGWSISVAYFAMLPAARAAALPPGACWQPIEVLPVLPFDHGAIVARALARIRDKATYSSLPAFLLGETFTLPQLHEVYCRVLGARPDPASFRRKIEAQGFIVPVPGAYSQDRSSRPAQLYRLAVAGLRAFDRTI